MVNRKTASVLTIAALLACAVPAKSVASLVAPIIAQAAPSFPVPATADENVRVSSSSDNMNSISEALAKGFESKYDGDVSIETKSADEALADVSNDNADVAAISRPLTAAEKASGLIDVAVRREKIAIIVGNDNPFSGSITSSQFAQIFRGEITDWSEVGGTAGPIRVVDRPDVSETRQALSPYPVFTTAAFETGSTATQVSEDSTAAIATELGTDGISYALVSELDSQSDIRAIELHKTTPDNPLYPFSQPYSFVYANAASPAAAAFLGYATGGEGQGALEGADISGYGVAPADATADAATADEADASASADASGADADADAEATDAGATDGSIGQLNDAGQLVDADGKLISPEGFLVDADGNLIDVDGNLLPDGEVGIPGAGINLDGLGNGVVDTAIEGAGSAVDGAVDGVGNAVDGVGDLAGRGRWWWLLLPLAGLGLLIWAASRRGSEEEASYSANARGTTDDRVRNSFKGSMPTVKTPDTPNVNMPDVSANANLGAIEADGIKTSVGNVGSRVGDMGKAGAMGAAGLAGGAAAGAAGLAGKMKGGVDSAKGSATSSLGNLRSNVQGGVQGGVQGVQGGIDGARTNPQGRIDGARTNLKGGIDGLKGGVDGVKGNVQGGVDGLKNNVQGGVDSLKGGIDGRLDGVGNNVRGGVDDLKGNIQSSADSVKGAASSRVDSVKDGANKSDDWLDRAKQRINEATDKVKNTASDIKDDVTKKD